MVGNGGTRGSGTVPNPVVAGWVDQLNELVRDCADDAALVDLVSSLESLKGASAGAQAAATVLFAGSQTAAGAAAKTRPEVVRRSVCGQVALARRDSAHRGGRHVGLALALHNELPCTREALAEGRISEWQATLICRETACLDPDLRRQADARLAGRLGSLGDAGVAREAARVVAELDPAAVAERAAKAARDRRVTVRPAPDTMAYLTALLPAANAVACYAALGAYATLAVGEGDSRGRGQIMADALTDRLTGGAITGCDEVGGPIRTEEPNQIRRNQTGPNPTGPDQTEPDQTAPDQTAPDQTEPDQTEPDQTEPDQTEPDQTEPDPAESDPAESRLGLQGSTETTSAVADPGEQDAAEQDQGAREQDADGADGPVSLGDNAAPTGAFDPVAALRSRSGVGAEVRCTCGCACERCHAPGSRRYRFPTLHDLREKFAAAPRSAIRFNINVIMSDRTLWRGSDEPADLVGYGAIPADLARDLVAADLGPDVKTFLRRFYTDPETGQLAAMDSTARFFTTNMKQFMLVRDRECRTPFCHAPVRHADHSDDHSRGGRTDVNANGTCRCEACNHAKQAPGWRVVNRPDGVIVTTTPTGHSYESPPPTPPGVAPSSRGRPEPRAQAEPTVAPVEAPAEPTVARVGKAGGSAARVAERAAPAAVQRVRVDQRRPRRRPRDSDRPHPKSPLDVVDLSARFPAMVIEYRAA